MTDAAGVRCANQYSSGAVLADLDGDGDLDLLVTGIGVGTRGFLNDGNGHFAAATDAGLVPKYAGTSMTLADVDGDGDLDLYVANYRSTTIRSTGFAVLNVGGKRMIRPEDRDHLEYTPDGRILELGEPHFFYRNDGAGHFTPMSWTDGTFVDERGVPLSKAPLDWGLSAMFRDLNGDGWPDLYVCNDFQSEDRVWLNDGHGHFRALPRLALRHTTTFSMCVDVGDLDRDGLDDIFVACMLSLDHRRRMMQLAAVDPFPPIVGLGPDRLQVDRNTLHHNRGDGTYEEIAQFARVDATDWTWSAALVDVDLDGFEDLLCATGHLFDTQDLDAEAIIQSKGPWRREQIPKKLLLFPRLPQAKVALRNRGDLTFEPAGARWGFDQVGVGHGMILADLDNDGDLDVVVNNLNGALGVYRNESPGTRVAVRLKGNSPNTHGIGARIEVSGGPVVQKQEMICGGRYLSGDEAMRVFAAGTARRMRIEVVWRNGMRSVVEEARPNCEYDIDERFARRAEEAEGARTEEAADRAGRAGVWFEDVSPLLQHVHHEMRYDDFVRQPLLPRRLSQLGPGIAWFDIDGDGRDDLIVGSGKGGRLGLFQNRGPEGFGQGSEPSFRQPVTRDQTGLVAFRNTSGKAVVLAGSANYEDGLAVGCSVRQYTAGALKPDDDGMGQLSTSGPLALVDWDGSGVLRLFVGGRVIPGRYPEPASSLLLRREGERWVIDDVNTEVLRNVGLVAGAVWTDLDDDGVPELVLACEWGPVRVYKVEGGKLREVTAAWGLEQSVGWWTGVQAGDFDGDGRMDLLVGNWGLNTSYRGAGDARRLYYGDFDGNGTVDLIESHFEATLKRWIPDRDRNSIVQAMPALTEKFPTHRAYSEASVTDLFGSNAPPPKVLEAGTLATTLFLNRGRKLEAVPLPREAQFAPVFGVVVADFDGDGAEDCFLSQNFFGNQPQVPRYDAGRGLLLQGDGAGHFRAIPGRESGLQLFGEQRGCAAADYDQDGRVDLAVTQNGAETKLFHNHNAKAGLRVRLIGPPGNPDGFGAALRWRNGEAAGPRREIHGGGGYWSQDATVQILAMPSAAAVLEVRWPGGKTGRAPVPTGAKAITIAWDGRVTVETP